MTDKDEFIAAANIIIHIKNLEGSLSLTNIHNKEKMAQMEQDINV